MRVTAREYKKLLNVVQILHEHTDEYEMRKEVAGPLLNLMGADYFASFCWKPEEGRYDQGVYLNMDDRNIGRYLDYFQYRDPITHKLAQRRAATRIEEIMPPRNLHKTEFFNDFLLKDGLYHGINLHLYQANQNIGDLRIWRKRNRDNFDQSANTLLDHLKPHLIQAIHNIRRLRQLHSPTVASAEEKSYQLKHKFCLTTREADITRLLLNGEGDEAIAANLHISVATVRTHVKHIFAKTGVHSRCKLQSLEM